MASLFTRDFDLEIEQEHTARTRQAGAIYTGEDLAAAVEAARREGFEEGRKAGHGEAVEEMRQSMLTQQAETLSAVSRQLGGLFAGSDAGVAVLEQQLLAYLLAIFEKVAPEMMAGRAAPRAEAEVRSALSLALGKSGLRVHLPPDIHAAIGKDLAAAAAASGFKGRTEVLADAALKAGDARVEWDNGFMEYSFDTICNRILDGLRAAAQPAGPQPGTDDEERTGD